MRTILAPFATAAVLALVLVPVCRVVATHFGCVAQPRTDRWHRRTVPLFGGVGIALAVLIGVVLFGDFADVAVLAGCAAVIFVVGLLDDIIHLKASTKLVAEIVVASAFLFFGYGLNWTGSLTGDSILTIIWIVGITNAFNLLDNMDGLCGGVAVIAVIALLSGLPLTSASGAPSADVRYMALLLGAISGFLVYNIHPASVFLGDAGSLFIGVSFASFALGSRDVVVDQSSLLSVVAAPVLVLLIPILDTTLVTLSRILSGRSAATGGRDHASHRLVAIGLSERAAVGVLWTLAGLAGAVGWAVRTFDDSWSMLLVSFCVVAMVLFAVYLAQVRVYDDKAGDLDRRRTWTPLVVDFMYKRRVAEVLLDFCLIAISYYGAYRLRFEDADVLLINFPSFLDSLPIVVASQLTALFFVGAYRGIWRYFSLTDAVVFGGATLLGTFTSVLVILYLYRFVNYSRTVFIIYAVLLFVALTFARAPFRLISEFAARRRHGGERLVIYGAGDGGSVALRELLKTSRGQFRMLGFIDDDSNKQQARVDGYAVMGRRDALFEHIRNGQVDVVVISSERIPIDVVDEVSRLCVEHGVRLSRLHLWLETLGPPLAGQPLAGRSNVHSFPDGQQEQHRRGAADSAS